MIECKSFWAQMNVALNDAIFSSWTSDSSLVCVSADSTALSARLSVNVGGSSPLSPTPSVSFDAPVLTSVDPSVAATTGGSILTVCGTSLGGRADALQVIMRSHPT